MAFKALAMGVCEANQRRAQTEVCTPHVLEVVQPAVKVEAEDTFNAPPAYIQAPSVPPAVKGWLPGAAAPMYESTAEDEAFLEAEAAAAPVEVSELVYERLVDTFELAEAEAATCPLGVDQVSQVTARQVCELLAQVPRYSTKLGGAPSTGAVERVHAQWLARREAIKGGQLLPRLTGPNDPNDKAGAFMCGEEAVTKPKKVDGRKNNGHVGTGERKANGPPVCKKRRRGGRAVGGLKRAAVSASSLSTLSTVGDERGEGGVSGEKGAVSVQVYLPSDRTGSKVKRQSSGESPQKRQPGDDDADGDGSNDTDVSDSDDEYLTHRSDHWGGNGSRSAPNLQLGPQPQRCDTRHPKIKQFTPPRILVPGVVRSLKATHFPPLDKAPLG
jgi:hypothetical protein